MKTSEASMQIETETVKEEFAASEELLAYSWESVSLTSKTSNRRGIWVIISPPSCTIADAIAEMIESADGASVSRIILEAGDDAEHIVTKELGAATDEAPRIIMFQSGNADSLDQHRGSWEQAWQLVEVARAASSRGRGGLWIVTCSAAILWSGELGDPRLNFAWGAFRSLAAETESPVGGIIDFQNSDPAHLLSIILGSSSDDEHLLHNDRLFVPRLRPLAIEKRAHGCSPTGLQLVTGGLTGIAFELSKWLAGCGAGHLLVVGRSGLDEARRENLNVLRTLYKSVQYLELDIGGLDSAHYLERTIGQLSMPLEGIYHLASSWHRNGESVVLPLSKLARGDIEEVLGAKSTGGIAVYQLGKRLGASLIVYFSSAAATIGSPGQVGYAGANAVLDGLAEVAAESGIRSCSISWGPIGEAGFGALAMGEGLHQLWSKVGVERLSLDSMFDGLEYAIASQRTSVTYIGMRKESLALPWLHRRAAYAELVRPTSTEAQASDEAMHVTVHMIEEQLLRRIPEILSLPSDAVTADSNLSEIGIDSLIALDLMFTIERELELTLPYAETILDLDVSIRGMSERVAAMLKTDKMAI